MPVGKVKFYHDEKGYGFIETDADDEVEFEIEEGDDGPRAVGVDRV